MTETLKQQMDEQNVFTTDTYSYYEYTQQLWQMQDMICRRVFKEKYHPDYRLEDAIYELKKKAIETEAVSDPRYRSGNASLKQIEKQICISASGKKAEDRVCSLISNYVTRDDVTVYRNVYLEYEGESTEIDILVICRDAAVILEVKNTKDDVYISENGRMFIGNECSYEQIPLADKMNRKRRVLKGYLKQALKDRSISMELNVRSFIVFNSAANRPITVENRSREWWCMSTQLPKTINNLYAKFPHSEGNTAVINDILAQADTKKKQFVSQLDFEQIKTEISNYVDLIESTESEPTMKDVLDAFRVFRKTLAAYTKSKLSMPETGMTMETASSEA